MSIWEFGCVCSLLSGGIWENCTRTITEIYCVNKDKNAYNFKYNLDKTCKGCGNKFAKNSENLDGSKAGVEHHDTLKKTVKSSETVKLQNISSVVYSKFNFEYSKAI